MHREGARALEPHGVAGPRVQLEERIAVAAGAVAEIRSLAQRPRPPDRFAGREQQVVDRGVGHAREADHESRRAVAELHQRRPGGFGVQPRAPVDAIAVPRRGSPHRIRDAFRPGWPFVACEQMPAADQRRGRRDEAVHGVGIGASLAVHVLRPIQAFEFGRPEELRPELGRRRPEQVGPARLAGPLVQEEGS